MAVHLPTDDAGSEGPDVIMEMNTTPLIDVMLVLLVMLIITIPIQLHSVQLQLPLRAPPAPPPRAVRIDVDAHSRIWWDGVELASREDLQQHVAQLAQLAPEQQPALQLRPDKAASYAAVAAVLAAVQRAHLDKFALVGGEQFAGALP